nr:MAG TPA: hypothetical protein [Caudoviricetes sp.]
MLVSIEVGKAPDTPVRELEMQDTPPCQYSHRSASGRKPMAAVQGRFSVCRSPVGAWISRANRVKIDAFRTTVA